MATIRERLERMRQDTAAMRGETPTGSRSGGSLSERINAFRADTASLRQEQEAQAAAREKQRQWDRAATDYTANITPRGSDYASMVGNISRRASEIPALMKLAEEAVAERTVAPIDTRSVDYLSAITAAAKNAPKQIRAIDTYQMPENPTGWDYVGQQQHELADAYANIYPFSTERKEKPVDAYLEAAAFQPTSDMYLAPATASSAGDMQSLSDLAAERAESIIAQRKASKTPLDRQREATDKAFRTANAFMPLEAGADYDEYLRQYDIAADEEAKLHALGGRSARELPVAAGKSFIAGALGAARGAVNALGYTEQMLERIPGAKEMAEAQMRANEGYFRHAGADYLADSYRQELAAPKNTERFQAWADFGEKYMQEAQEMASGFGSAGRAITNVAQGVGGMIPSILTNIAVPGSGLWVMMTQAAGNATEEAIERGASDANAILYGIGVGAIEGLTEKMFGGIPGLGVGALDDGIENAIKNAVGNEAAQRAMLFLIDALGEGVEEFTSEFGDHFLNKWLVGSDKRSFAETNKDALYSALIGALTSVAMQVPASVLQSSTGRKQLARQLADQVGATIPKGSIGTDGQLYVNQYAQTVLKSGSVSPAGVVAMTENYNGGTDAAEYIKGMTRAYNAGAEGTALSEVNAPGLTQQQIKAAYEAGAAQKVQEAKPAQQAQEVNGKPAPAAARATTPGFINDEIAAKAKLTRQEARQLDALGKILGVEVRFADRIESNNAAAANRSGITQGRYENGRITLALDAKDPFMTTAVHETIHRIRDLSPESYDALEKFVTRNMGETNLATDQAVKEGSYPAGTNLTEETVADAFGRMIGDAKLLNQFVADNRGVAQKVFDALHDMLVKVQRALTGDSRKLTAEEKALYKEMEGKLSTMLSLYGEALQQAGESAGTENGARNSIEQTADGKKYVKADRQVIYGNDPDAWGEQLEGYINGKIRRGQDVELITEDGEVVKLTATSAGKLADNHRSNGTSLTDAEYERKVNAATHIDELVETSSNKNRTVKDHDARHGDMASGGWTYNTAYFEDFDGKYYRVKISVAHGPDGNLVYNIGDMQERSPATMTGSSAQGGALNGGTSSNGSINDAEGKSNPHSSMSERELLAEYMRRYGTLDQGEEPARNVSLPARTADKTKLSMTARTAAEAGATPEEFVPNIENMAARHEFDYTPESDEDAIKGARATLEKNGWDETLAKWEKDVGKGKVSKANTAMGWALYDAAANTGKTETALQILRDIVKHQRSAAQATQAGRILKQLNPDTQLYNAEKTVEDLQRDLVERYGKKAPNLQIDPDLAEKFLRAKTQEGRDEAMAEIYRDIGRQMPTTFRERWNAWRYLAMLGNPRTHVRNVFGNLGFAPVVAAKDLTATAIEGIVSKATGGRLERTKGNIIGHGDLLKAAYGDFENIRAEALGEGKYTDQVISNSQIEEGRKIFGNTRSAAWNKTAGAALEAFRKGNSTLLDKEDVIFSRPHYALALAQYCSANHISAAQIAKGEGLAKARAYAIKEAQKATYRDTNDFSEFVSKLGRFGGMEKNATARVASMVTEGILPFRKTPANILVRGVEYSPLGLLKSLTADMVRLKQGKISGAELIDNISAGLTGTGLAGLGALMVKLGLLRGFGSSDEEKEKFKDLTGHQQYALELPGGTSITLDWLAPEALPFFIGANIMETAMERSNGVKMADVLGAIKNIGEPLLEMSCLQSLNSALDNLRYAKNNKKSALVAVLSAAATSYITQALPTLFGQIERTAEDKRMTTYTDKNSFLTSDAQYTLGKASAKVPGLEFNQIPYIDAWGREELTGSFLARGANNFFNPSFLSKVNESDMEKELGRLYDATGKEAVLPRRAGKSFKVDGKEIDLTGDEYVQYATDRGRTAYAVIGNMVKTDAYKGMSDDEKVSAVSAAYEYATQTAQSEFGREPEKWVTNAKNGVNRGIHVETYITTKVAATGITSLKDKNGDTIKSSEDLQEMEYIYSIPGLNDEQRKYLFECFSIGKSVINLNKAAVHDKLVTMRRQAVTPEEPTKKASTETKSNEIEYADSSGSSAVWSVSYDRKNHTATVKWSENGKPYTYDGVSEDDWEAYLAAPSKGAYINKHWK